MSDPEFEAKMEAELKLLVAQAMNPRLTVPVTVNEGYGDDKEVVLPELPPIENVSIEELENELIRLEPKRTKHRFAVTRPPPARIQPQNVPLVEGEEQYKAPRLSGPRQAKFYCTPEELSSDFISKIVARWNIGTPIASIISWSNERLQSHKIEMRTIDIYATIALAMTHETEGKAPTSREKVNHAKRLPSEMPLDAFKVFLRQWRGGECFELCKRSLLPYENEYCCKKFFGELNKRWATMRREEELTKKQRAENPFTHPVLRQFCRRHAMDGKQYIVFPVEMADEMMKASFKTMPVYIPPSVVTEPTPDPDPTVEPVYEAPVDELEPAQSELLRQMSQTFNEMNDAARVFVEREVQPTEIVSSGKSNHGLHDLSDLLDPQEPEEVNEALPHDMADMDINELLGVQDHVEGRKENGTN